MTQNRKKLLDHFIGNAVMVIVHRVLMASTEKDYLKVKYGKEALNSFTKAQGYREKIHPKGFFSDSESREMHEALVHKVKLDLQRRVNEGYSGINPSLVKPLVETFLKEMNITQPAP